MLNIMFKGNYVSDDQLIKQGSIPEDAVEFGIVSNLQSEFGRGFLILMPLFAAMVAATYWKVRDLDYHLTMGMDVIVSFVLIITSVYLLTFVHEIIHALFYPADAVKEIWKSREQAAYFVYCEREISRERFIAMCLAPLFLLGILPFAVWLLLPHIIPMPCNMVLPFVSWLMTIVAMGDVANVYHVVREVPKGAKVFNYGLLRSFYIRR